MPLGRGLAALITPTVNNRNIRKDNGLDETKIWYIPVNSIKPNPQQPRRDFKPRELDELAVSIKEHGILQPILLTEKVDGGYEIVAGERRWRAAQLAGLATLPAIVKKMADQQKLEVALIENIQRENLNPLEEAFAFERLMKEFNFTQQQVADKVGKSRPAIANTLRLLDLPEEIKKALIDGRINMGQARALLGLDSQEKRLEMLSSMLGQKITVREIERSVGKQNNNGRVRRDPNLLYIEDQLRAALGTKVSITKKGDKGTIVIDYYSKDDLNRLMKKLAS